MDNMVQRHIKRRVLNRIRITTGNRPSITQRVKLSRSPGREVSVSLPKVKFLFSGDGMPGAYVVIDDFKTGED